MTRERVVRSAQPTRPETRPRGLPLQGPSALRVQPDRKRRSAASTAATDSGPSQRHVDCSLWCIHNWGKIMNSHVKLIFAIAATAFAGMAASQPASDSTRTTGRSAGETVRDAGSAVGRAASAAVTPGDQNMGRTPENRSGGLMGDDRTGTRSAATSAGRAASAAVTPGDQNMGRNPGNRSGGLMGSDRTGTPSDTTRGPRSARADRG